MLLEQFAAEKPLIWLDYISLVEGDKNIIHVWQNETDNMIFFHFILSCIFSKYPFQACFLSYSGSYMILEATGWHGGCLHFYLWSERITDTKSQYIFWHKNKAPIGYKWCDLLFLLFPRMAVWPFEQVSLTYLRGMRGEASHSLHKHSQQTA